eukprot:1868761-Prymnesium_polylepis.1
MHLDVGCLKARSVEPSGTPGRRESRASSGLLAVLFIVLVTHARSRTRLISPCVQLVNLGLEGSQGGHKS